MAEDSTQTTQDEELPEVEVENEDEIEAEDEVEIESVDELEDDTGSDEGEIESENDDEVETESDVDETNLEDEAEKVETEPEDEVEADSEIEEGDPDTEDEVEGPQTFLEFLAEEKVPIPPSGAYSDVSPTNDDKILWAITPSGEYYLALDEAVRDWIPTVSASNEPSTDPNALPMSVQVQRKKESAQLQQ